MQIVEVYSTYMYIWMITKWAPFTHTHLPLYPQHDGYKKEMQAKISDLTIALANITVEKTKVSYM